VNDRQVKSLRYKVALNPDTCYWWGGTHRKKGTKVTHFFKAETLADHGSENDRGTRESRKQLSFLRRGYVPTTRFVDHIGRGGVVYSSARPYFQRLTKKKTLKDGGIRDGS